MTTQPSPHLQRLAREIAGQGRQIRALSKPRLGHSSFEQGEAVQQYGTEGQIVQRVGTQFDGTNVPASFNGPTPPAPTAPTAEPAFGGAAVTWDGFWEPDQTVVAPMDWVRTEVHVGDTSDFDASTAATLRTTFDTPRGGTKFVSAAPGTRYVRLVARTLSGKASPASGSVAVEVVDPNTLGGNAITYSEDPPAGAGIAEGDTHFQLDGSGNVVAQFRWSGTAWEPQQIENEMIAGIAVGKLIAGTLAADSAIIVGDPSGAHVRIDGDGTITGQNAAADETLRLDGEDNVIVGQLATGKAPDARVEVSRNGTEHVVEFFGEDQPAGRRAFLEASVGSASGYSYLTSIKQRAEADDVASEVLTTPVGVFAEHRDQGPDTLASAMSLGQWWSFLRGRRMRLAGEVVDPVTGAMGLGEASVVLKGNQDISGGPTPGSWGAVRPLVYQKARNGASEISTRLGLGSFQVRVGASVDAGDDETGRAEIFHVDANGMSVGPTSAPDLLVDAGSTSARLDVVAGRDLTAGRYVEVTSRIRSHPNPATDPLVLEGSEIRMIGYARLNASTGSWTTPTFVSGWSAYSGGGGYGPVKFKITPDGMLAFSGLAVRSGAALAAGASSDLFTLPTAFRPAESNQFTAAMSVGGYCRVNILTTGVVSVTGLAGSLSTGNFVVLTGQIPMD